MRALRLGAMLRGRREGGAARWLIHAVISVALRLFFRRIEASGASLVPERGAVLFVLNHPNGLIDPALVFAALPRPVSFLAKSTLFRLPVLGSLLRAVGALPLYRRADAGEDVSRNPMTFEECRRLLARGGAVALFPEGVSHSEPKLLPLKTGAARIALGAAAPVLKIVPVGLYYTSKTSFRSEALLRFGEPIDVPAVEPAPDGEPPPVDVRELSSRIEAGLRGVTVNAETEEQLDVARKAERLFSSVYEGLAVRLPLAERFESLRRMTDRLAGLLPFSVSAEQLGRRILAHEGELRRAGLAPENLSLSTHSRWYVFRHFLLRAGAIALLSPLALAGAALHYPAYLACSVLARLFPKHGVDDIAPTVKILAALVLMPLTWLVAAALVFSRWGWRWGLATLPLSALCGYVAMRSIEELYDLRGWFKAILLLARRRRLFLRLFAKSRALRDEISRLG
ncbi:MAG TPA: lysophospholipid acyltransferase family protein [Pyrinomonadaceae bacterium]|nr:lysophospholipid acyltransferase family protein [Pyrinomonadaceae bacterium]